MESSGDVRISSGMKSTLGRSLLLEVPGEIRNRVYEMCAQGSTARVTKSEGVTFQKTSGLIGVNRQIRKEYRGILGLISSPVIVDVDDFDFSHVMDLLDELTPRELSALPKVTTPPRQRRRKIWLELDVTLDCPKDPEGLRLWLDRVADPSKKVTMWPSITGSYHICPGHMSLSMTGGVSCVAVTR